MLKVSPFQLITTLHSKDERIVNRLRTINTYTKTTERQELSDEDFKKAKIDMFQ
jgi:hypothetical protein